MSKLKRKGESISYTPVMNKNDYNGEAKANQVYNDADTWRAVILDCDGEDKPEIKKDEEHNQDVAIKGESVIGVFDYDLGCGVVMEANEEFEDQDEWLKSLGDEVTIEQGDDSYSEKDAPTVAKDKDGNIVGTFTTVDGKGRGVNIKDESVSKMSSQEDWADRLKKHHPDAEITDSAGYAKATVNGKHVGVYSKTKGLGIIESN